MIEEKLYRKLVDDTYARIDRAFEDVDPDLAEVTISQGALTIVFGERLRLMLTPQPPVRQLWVAFRDRAWHFDWDAGRGAWLDDRGQGVELERLVADTTRQTAKVDVRIARP
ncbi:MAG TPA: iron donor protein CyaY [Polyangia bacterium]|nr:iron donor protein CyaY [Polyangia bacterium]